MSVYRAFTTLQARPPPSSRDNGTPPLFATMNCASTDIENAVAALRQEATSLAGGLGDLAQRASVYHHLYQHSEANHCFPLLAAHGALWASGYFRSGMRVGSILAWAHAAAGNQRRRRELMQRLTRFANDFRDINRRVCVETYFIYHLSSSDSLLPAAERLIPSDLLSQMARCHAARRAGRTLSDRERRSLFEAFFLWEQATIVGPAVEKAFAEFDWPAIKAMALRPRISFAYLPRPTPLVFSSFSDTAERIEKGLQAFDLAASAGWDKVDRDLRNYGILPSDFSVDPNQYFANLLGSLGAYGALESPSRDLRNAPLQ
ncbi:hypothetical protein JQ604_10965 [Bradyrhizobium jicamae]|uniref:hypothetical protein n=1 Tax=Bradyrhizobium jicamae TaxID=280332 RepID=UPI001BA736CB|nr:hypothetical protein [Bradyrhizobium jicamae]MBR0752706.1 hypothetical protein [Bradyrhizobium jicamae]